METEILSLWRAGKKPGKISRLTGYPVVQVCRVIADASSTIISVKPETFDGWGRPEMRRHIVARRAIWTDWDNPEGVAQARADYDAGLSEMCQGRDGDIMILYSIPRVNPCKPRDYFSGENV